MGGGRREYIPQTPSTGLQHPSLEEGAGKRCSECVYTYRRNDSCIKMSSVVSHFNVSVIVEVGEGGDYIPSATLSPPE